MKYRFYETRVGNKSASCVRALGDRSTRFLCPANCPHRLRRALLPPTCIISRSSSRPSFDNRIQRIAGLQINGITTASLVRCWCFNEGGQPCTPDGGVRAAEVAAAATLRAHGVTIAKPVRAAYAWVTHCTKTHGCRILRGVRRQGPSERGRACRAGVGSVPPSSMKW